jgi:predicted nucleotidyltransferase
MDPELIPRLRDVAADALAALPVRFAYLFGSQVAGRPRPGSDIDVAILADDAVGEEAYDRLALRCADALTVASGVPRIEVTVLNRALS